MFSALLNTVMDETNEVLAGQQLLRDKEPAIFRDLSAQRSNYPPLVFELIDCKNTWYFTSI